MIAPILYKPFGIIWFGISNIMGTVMSKVVLTVIFLALVTPVAILRRIYGADSLQLKKWKKSTHSVFNFK